MLISEQALVLRAKLRSVLKARYDLGQCCLENTRVNLLTTIDTWVRGSCIEKAAWVYGYASSGKTTLFNSIAENLEKVGIPFTCFPCKRDDPDLSNVRRILPTISYSLTGHYGDYWEFILDFVEQTYVTFYTYQRCVKAGRVALWQNA